jgi:hypothetical protein
MGTLTPCGRFAEQFALETPARFRLLMAKADGADNFLSSTIAANQCTSCFETAGGNHAWCIAYDDQTPETGDAVQDFG